MRVLVKAPGEEAVVVGIPQADDCSEYKKLMGLPPSDSVSGVYHPTIGDVYILCDDIGKLRPCPPPANFNLPEYNDYTVGTIVFLGMGFVDGESDFISLTDEQIDELRGYLATNSF